MAVAEEISKDHVGAYAAQSAYFFMLSMIPIILLLLTLVQFTPVTKADVMTAVLQVFPSSVSEMVISIVNQVYNQSATIIPLTILVALWSAGKGVLAMNSGLNSIYKCHETRNYIVLRIRATFYTLIFIGVIVLLLLGSVFGNILSLFISEHIPLLNSVAEAVIEKRTIVSSVVLVLASIFVYKFLPNRKDDYKNQIPGAIFSAIGWLTLSWIFSVYVDIFQGFSDMYGSLTTIILIMLWLYFCMYSILLGAEINKFCAEKLGKGK